MVDEYGEPIPLFHGTNKDFSAFRRPKEDVGIHMGTSGQANDRIDALRKRWADEANNRAWLGEEPSDPRVLPVYANFKNPYRVEDIGNFDFDNMTHQLRDLEEVPYYLSDVHDLLGRNGYDGLVYKNTGETAGAAPFRDAADAALEHLTALQKKYGYGPRPEINEAIRDYTAAADKYRIFRERNAEDSYAAFYPTQIKSRFNRGTYDPFDPDIWKAEGGLIR
jgi:hypothetical protein